MESAFDTVDYATEQNPGKETAFMKVKLKKVKGGVGLSVGLRCNPTPHINIYLQYVMLRV